MSATTASRCNVARSSRSGGEPAIPSEVVFTRMLALRNSVGKASHPAAVTSGPNWWASRSALLIERLTM